MKTMSCKQLGGACEQKFTANTFEEMAQMSQQHGMEMYQKNDAEHLKAMEAMRDLMKDPVAMQAWMDDKKRMFEELPES